MPSVWMTTFLIGFAIKIGFAGIFLAVFGVLLLPVALLVGAVLFFKVLIIGIPLGILSGTFRRIGAFFAPVVVFGRNIPVAALIPLTMLWFGIDDAASCVYNPIYCSAQEVSHAYAILGNAEKRKRFDRGEIDASGQDAPFQGGFYRRYAETGQGDRAVVHYTVGAQAFDIEVDIDTGKIEILKGAAAFDVGKAINPELVKAQIEGGFVQGAGWLTSEELWWNDAGELGTHAPSTYKIPTCSDLAPDFRVELLENAANREDTIYRSKAVGEPPLMLAISAFERRLCTAGHCSPNCRVS